MEELVRIKGYNRIKTIEPEKNRKKETLNWKQKFSFEELVGDMVESDLKLITNTL